MASLGSSGGQNLRELSIGMLTEFTRVLSAAGFDTTTVRGIIKRPKEAERMYAAIKGEGGVIYRDLIHGRFVTPDQQTSNVERWNAEYDLGFSEKDFKRVPPPPAWPMDNKFCALVLVPYLQTERQTFVRLASLFVPAKPDGALDLGGYDINTLGLRLAHGVEHRPGLAWEVIDLAAHSRIARPPHGWPPASVFSEGQTTAGILAAAAHHPVWAHQLNGRDAPYPYMGGYLVDVPHEAHHPHIPYLYCRAGEERIHLSFGRGNWSNGDDATPIILNR